jgi:alkaline phosphatase
MEDTIALQQIGNYTLGRQVDLMFGGGSCHFKPGNTTGSCRTDGLDLLQIAKENYGWTFVDSKKDFDGVRSADV